MTSPPLHVVFVIQRLLGLSGGAERVFLDTVRAMSARGMKIEIVIYDNGYGAPCYGSCDISIENLFPLRSNHRSTPKAQGRLAKIKKLGHGGVMAHVKWALTHGLFARRLRAALSRKRPDLVVAFLPPAITAAIRAADPLRIPVIASLHNVPSRDYDDPTRWDQNPVYRRRARDAVLRADAITVLLDEFRQWFPAKAQRRVHVIPNSAKRLSPMEQPAPTRSKTVLAVGRLTTVKRFDLLIKAWADLQAEHPDWSVSIYGEGPEGARLQAMIIDMGLAGSVTLEGTTDKLGPIYDRAALLCHPAAFEGFGLVVAEALSHGMPVVGFADCPGVNTLVANGVNGTLVNSDPSAPHRPLVTALRAYIRDQPLREKHGMVASDTSSAYAPETIAAHWETLITGLCPRD